MTSLHCHRYFLAALLETNNSWRPSSCGPVDGSDFFPTPLREPHPGKHWNLSWGATDHNTYPVTWCLPRPHLIEAPQQLVR